MYQLTLVGALYRLPVPNTVRAQNASMLGFKSRVTPSGRLWEGLSA